VIFIFELILVPKIDFGYCKMRISLAGTTLLNLKFLCKGEYFPKRV